VLRLSAGKIGAAGSIDKICIVVASGLLFKLPFMGANMMPRVHQIFGEQGWIRLETTAVSQSG
jgi:hypothetical protein